MRTLGTFPMLLLLGCASPEGTGSLEGTIDGRPEIVRDAIFGHGRYSTGFIVTETHRSTSVEISLTTFGGACDLAEDQDEPASSAWLTMVLSPRDPEARGFSLAPGSYALGDAASAQQVEAHFERTDHRCEMTFWREATAGVVHIDSADVDRDDGGFAEGGELHGRYELTIGDEEVTGSFGAVFCTVAYYLGGSGSCVRTD